MIEIRISVSLLVYLIHPVPKVQPNALLYPIYVWSMKHGSPDPSVQCVCVYYDEMYTPSILIFNQSNGKYPNTKEKVEVFHPSNEKAKKKHKE